MISEIEAIVNWFHDPHYPCNDLFLITVVFRMRIPLLWVFVSVLLVSPVSGEPLSLVIGSGIVAGFSYLGYVKQWHKMIMECYGERRELKNIGTLVFVN